jgi:hypothetical protein
MTGPPRFHAMASAERDGLPARLQAFAPELPGTVAVRYIRPRAPSGPRPTTVP